MEEKQLRESKFSYGGKKLHELTHAELLESIESIWERKNAEVTKTEAQLDAYQNLLKSPFPIHAMWRSYAELVWFSIWIIVLISLIIHAAKG